MTLLPLIERQMSSNPSSVAVEYNGRQFTYRQLREEAARIAGGLRREGVGAGALIGVFLNRSPEMVASLLGIWRAGAAYLPLDPTHPKERISLMLEDSRVPFVLSETALLAALPRTAAKVLDLNTFSTDRAAGSLDSRLPDSPDSLAYVIYTSGSTGRPKGAKISHRGLANTIQGLQAEMRLNRNDIVLASNTIAFDVAGIELYLPLMNGARVYLVDRDVVADGPRLMGLLRDARITTLMGMATTYRLLLEAGWRGNRNLQMTVGGEALPQELADLLVQRSRVIWNHYGPTETSICATTEKIQAGAAKVTLGRPLPNVRIYVLDAERKPLPPGTVGEIYIGGEGVGQGYLNRPELTSACFLPDPFAPRPGATMYKTGDLGMLLPDGRLDFQGRVDEQIKVRGFRIELGEVEAALRDCEGIKDCVVRAIEFTPEDKRLIAFVICDGAMDADRLRASLRLRLPRYMVPSEYIALDRFPVAPNGKVDRQALSALRLATVSPSFPDPPAGDLEAGLQAIWRRIFRVDSVQISDNFFDLGGHSLLAMRMLIQVEKQFATRVPISILAERPTIQQLAAYIRQCGKGGSSFLVKIQSGGKFSPLFVVHGIGGSLLTFRELAAALGEDQPVLGLRLPASLEETGGAGKEDLLKRLVAKYVEEIRAVDPVGPYQLAGHSAGGLIVFEIAQQLQHLGFKVRLLFLLDCGTRMENNWNASWKSWGDFKASLSRNRARVQYAFRFGLRELIRRRIKHHRLRFQTRFLQLCENFVPNFQSSSFIEAYIAFALDRYSPLPYQGNAVLYAAEDEFRSDINPDLGWAPKILGNLEIVPVPGGHQSIFERPHVRNLADQLTSRLSSTCHVVKLPIDIPPIQQRAQNSIAPLQCIGVQG